jgi:hypothetical protein
MSATIVKFDPLVALHCRWNALHAECERLLNEGQARRLTRSANRWLS